MRSWFRRVQNAAAPQPTAPAPDSPTGLALALDKLVDRINRSAGRLPIAALVVALDVTDVVDQLLQTTIDDVVPDVDVIRSVRGVVDDYLPTTLDRYLALDPSIVDRPMSNGKIPRHQVIEQLEALVAAAGDVLSATRGQDADDLVTQGNFLRTKFTRSDLDL